MTKILWNTSFLEEKAEQLRITPSVQFWECDSDGNVMKFTEEHYKKMIKNFFPFLGVYNLQMGENEKGVPTSTLVLVCENRCEEIDSKTLKSITFKILNNLGSLGSDIRTTFYKGVSNPVFNDEALSLIPDLEGKTPFADNQLASYRFFQNGWIEITSNGVSNLKSYGEIPENVIVWNSSVIPRDYHSYETKDDLENQLTGIMANAIHPDTGENIYSKNVRMDLAKEWQEKIAEFKGKNPPSHFKDFVRNLSRDDNGEFDEKSLERIEIAIGYLCHRYNNPSGRKLVCFVDKFYDGFSYETANGGTGKSLLVNSLGLVMNLTNLNGKSFTARGHRNLLSPVTSATEICHFDDASKKFDTERLFPLITGNFHIEANYKNPFSIPAKNAPKIAVTSNSPLQGNGFSFQRRQFIVEIGNFYRIQAEENGIQYPVYEEHGRKNFPDSHSPVLGSWDDEDWDEYFRYIFSCVSKYLSKGLPLGGESEIYQRAKLISQIGSEEVYEFIADKLETYEVGKEYFCSEFYQSLQDAFPTEMENISGNKMWEYLKGVGRLLKIYPNKNSGGKPSQQRLSKKSLKKWCDVGLENWVDRNGKKKGLRDVVFVFTISKMTSPESMFSSTPDFKKDDNPEEVEGLEEFFKED